MRKIRDDLTGQKFGKLTGYVDIDDVMSVINEVCDKKLYITRIRQTFLDAIKTIAVKKEYKV